MPPSPIPVLLECQFIWQDDAHAVNSCAHYTICPKKSHEAALKRIGIYLKLTRDKGVNLKSSKHLRIHAYPEGDFSGLHEY
ncbi:hypothetical protein ACHAXS_004438 [Conticribra weissflogii]